MERYHLGEVVLLEFPFADAAGSKRRPALVLLDTGDIDLVVARITSQLVHTPFDVELVRWKEAGLLLPSVVRVHKLATLEKALVKRRLGTLAAGDWEQAKAKLRQLWATVFSL